jgi:hypothetical protein
MSLKYFFFILDDQIIELEEVTSEIFFTLATIIVRFEFCRKYNECGGLLRLKLAMDRHCTMVHFIIEYTIPNDSIQYSKTPSLFSA